MSFRARKQAVRVRKATDDDDDDDGGAPPSATAAAPATAPAARPLPTKAAAPTAASNKGPALSFALNDDDDEDGPDGVKVKKSKASRLMKKRLQAPVDLGALLQDAAPAPATATSGGAYSASSLAELRQQQKYADPVVAADTTEDEGSSGGPAKKRRTTDGAVEGLELAGDAAETMEELTERLEASGGAGAYFSSLGAGVGTKKSVRFVDERQEHADRLALRASRTARPQEADALLGDDRDGDGDADGMGGGRGGERVAFAPRAALRDFVPLDGEASDWENEVVSRGRQGGALHAAPLPPSTHALYGALAGVSATPAWVPSGANGGGGGLGGGGVAEGGLTIDDVRRALARAADALATALDEARRRRAQLLLDADALRQRDGAARGQVEGGVGRLNGLRELRVYCAEVRPPPPPPAA
jgi:hypothetical protein